MKEGGREGMEGGMEREQKDRMGREISRCDALTRGETGEAQAPAADLKCDQGLNE